MLRRARIWPLIMVVAFCWLAPVIAEGAATNLIQNPGAESGPASPDQSSLASIPGWTTDGAMSVYKYATSGTDLGVTSPGPPDRGNNYFAGAISSVARISQVIDVSSSATQIDAGTLPFTLSGWLGGWQGQNDNAALRATFKDAAGATLGSASIGPVLAAERNSVTSLVFKTTSGTVPAKTRKVEVVLETTRTEGSYNDGYADNLSLVLGGSTSGGGTGGTGGGGTGGGTSGATVESQVMTNAVPATGSCSAPTSVTSFLTTDPQAYMFFILRDVRVGDVVATEWTAPDGSIPTPPSGPYEPETQAGSYCYKEKLKIAGDVGAKLPGSWKVRAYLNGVLLFTLTFTINAPTATGLTVNVNQVITSACPKITVVASVTDSAGKPVAGLSASDFTLKEDGQAQTIAVTSSGAAGGSALSVAIVIDHSTSLSSQDLANEKSAAKALVAQLGPADTVAVYGFGTTVEPLQDFTTDKAKVNSAIDSISAGGSTALYLAVVAAAQKSAPRSGRKAIVLMTDGENNQGGTIDDAINQAKLAGSPIFPVGFGSANTAILTRMAKDTGGVYTPAANSSALVNVLQNIGAVIAAQYEISYTTSNPSSTHTLELTAKSGSSQSVAVTQSLAACQASGSSGAVTLKVENTSGAAGASVDVPVTLTATTPPSTFQYDLGYDSSKLTFVQAKQGDQTRAANKDIATNALSSNSLRVVAAGLNQGLIGNGTVVLMNFKLNGGFASGSTTLTCSNPASADANGKAITPTTCQGGTVTARSACSCDVNGDGVTNVSDVQLIVNQALGIIAGRCDINADGQTNVLDVQMVINATLGAGCK